MHPRFSEKWGRQSGPSVTFTGTKPLLQDSGKPLVFKKSIITPAKTRGWAETLKRGDTG